MFDFPEAGRLADALLPEKSKLLTGIIETCRERGIRLILFIHPEHALVHARAGAPPLLPYEAERREIVQLVAGMNEGVPADERVDLWDFGDFHPINCDPLPVGEDGRMNYWADFNHFTLEIGGVMLARMLDWPIELEIGKNYGIRLTPETFDAWVEGSKAGYQRYVEGAGREDLKWRRQVVEGPADE